MKEKEIWPVLFNDKLWWETDSDELFVSMYEFREQLNPLGGIYLTEDLWLYPDGNTGEW